MTKIIQPNLRPAPHILYRARALVLRLVEGALVWCVLCLLVVTWLGASFLVGVVFALNF